MEEKKKSNTWLIIILIIIIIGLAGYIVYDKVITKTSSDNTEIKNEESKTEEVETNKITEITDKTVQEKLDSKVGDIQFITSFDNETAINIPRVYLKDTVSASDISVMDKVERIVHSGEIENIEVDVDTLKSIFAKNVSKYCEDLSDCDYWVYSTKEVKNKYEELFDEEMPSIAGQQASSDAMCPGTFGSDEYILAFLYCDSVCSDEVNTDIYKYEEDSEYAYVYTFAYVTDCEGNVYTSIDKKELYKATPGNYVTPEVSKEDYAKFNCYKFKFQKDNGNYKFISTEKIN